MLHHRILPRRHHSFATPLHNFLLISAHGLPERLATIAILLQCPPDIRGIANGIVQALATICSQLANSTSAPMAGEGTYGMSLDAPRPLPGPRCLGGHPTQHSATGPSDRSSGLRCWESQDTPNVGLGEFLAPMIPRPPPLLFVGIALVIDLLPPSHDEHPTPGFWAFGVGFFMD